MKINLKVGDWFSSNTDFYVRKWFVTKQYTAAQKVRKGQ